MGFFCVEKVWFYMKYIGGKVWFYMKYIGENGRCRTIIYIYCTCTADHFKTFSYL